MNETQPNMNEAGNVEDVANNFNEVVDLPIANIDNQNGSESVLMLRTDNKRCDISPSEVQCSICFYNSEEDDTDEQEKKITRRTLYDTKRYAQMFACIPSEDNVFKCICSHKFHTTCLYQWIKSSREFKCPMCRASVGETNVKLENIPELYGSEPEYIVQYYPNGKVQMECYKEHGVLENFIRKYDLLGNITYDCGYSKGDKHGDEIEYHQHTTKKAKLQQYRHGTKHGDYIEYSLEENSETGTQVITRKIQYQNGMMHGSEEEWFISTKTKKRECFYHEGLKHGMEKVWTITGSLIFYKKYNYGRPNGRCIVRFPDNGCIERKCYYNEHGQPDGLYMEWQYACKSFTKGTNNTNKSGGGGGGFSLISMLTGGGLNLNAESSQDDTPKDNGNTTNTTTTDVVLKIKSHYIDGALYGKYEEYHDNGELNTLAYYNKNGNLDEEYFEFDRFGRCILRYIYNDGKLDGLCERFYETGKIKECGVYVNDVLHGLGSYKQFYANGKLKVRQSYKNGVLHGETIYYTQKGAVAAKYIYDNGNCPTLSFQ